MILQKKSLELLLSNAKRLEKEYEWLQAAEVYEKTFGLAQKENNFFKTAELQDKKGFCCFKAALQSNTKSQFKNRLELAI